MFELETTTKAKLLDVSVLSQKNRPVDANPGASLAFSVELPNSALSMLDGLLRNALYTKIESTEVPAQDTLDGVEPVSDTPNLTGIGRKIGTFSWDLELTGYTLTFDQGLGGKSNLVVSDCKLDAWHVTPKEGGTVIVKFKAEANDVDERTFGKLAVLKSRDVQILLAPPEISADLVLDPASDKAWPFPNDPKGSITAARPMTPEEAFTGTATPDA